MWGPSFEGRSLSVCCGVLIVLIMTVDFISITLAKEEKRRSDVTFLLVHSAIIDTLVGFRGDARMDFVLEVFASGLKASGELRSIRRLPTMARPDVQAFHPGQGSHGWGLLRAPADSLWRPL